MARNSSRFRNSLMWHVRLEHDAADRHSRLSDGHEQERLVQRLAASLAAAGMQAPPCGRSMQSPSRAASGQAPPCF